MSHIFTQHRFTLLAVVILGLSFVFRFWQLGNVPVGLYWDEVAMYVDAKTVSQSLKDMHGNSALQAMFPSYGDYKLPVYIWLASLSFKLFGASNFALRLPSAIAGILQGYLIFVLVKELSNKFISKEKSQYLGLLGWFVSAVSPWSVLFSRTGFEGHIGQLLICASVFSFVSSKRNRLWLIPAIVLGILSTYTYYSVRFVWPIVFIGYWFLLQPFPKTLLQFVKSSFVSVALLLIWGIGILPLFFSPWYQPSQQFRLSTPSLMDLGPYSIRSNEFREMSGNGPLSRVFYHQRVLQLRDVLEHYADHFDFSYLFISGDKNLRHSTGFDGLFLLFSAPLLVAGILYLVKNDVRLFLFLFGWWLIALLPASIPIETPHALRSLNALTPILLLMSFGGIPITQIIQSIRPASFRFGAVFLIILMITVQVTWFTVDYFFIYPGKSAHDWQEGYQTLAKVIEDKHGSYDKVWANPYDDRFFLWYLAYSNMDAQRIQSIMKDTFLTDRIDNIIFQEFPFDKSNPSVRPFMTIKRSTADNDENNPSTTQQEILGYDHQPLFIIRYYER